jgi:hypothetical protein
VHFRSGAGPEARNLLDQITGAPRRADGSSLARGYFPDDTLAAFVASEGALQKLRRSEHVVAIERHAPRDKFDELWLEEAEVEPRRWIVELFPGHPGAVEDELATQGARTLERVHHRGRRGYDLDFVRIEARACDLTRLASIEGIRQILPAWPGAEASGDLPDELGARTLEELLARSRAGRLCGDLPRVPIGSGADPVRALLELLVFDDPNLVVTASDPLVGSGCGEEVLRNAIVLRDSPALEALPQAARLADARPPSASLVRARYHALGGPDRTAQVERDVPAAQGFVGPSDEPRVLELLCVEPETPLVVALAWTDEPAPMGPTSGPVNELDLVVTGPDGVLYRGSGDPQTATHPGGEREAQRTAEFVRVSHAAPGRWRVTVRPVRGSFAEAQGFALLAAGGVIQRDAFQPLAVPVTIALQPTAGRLSDGSALQGSDLTVLAARDDQRLRVRDRSQLTLAFGAGVPAGATVTALRLAVEHHEEARVVAGNVQWLLGSGSPTSPSIAASTSAPLRSGAGAEALDLWSVPTLAPNANALVAVIQNDSRDDDTLLDAVWVEVDYLAEAAAPRITSLPSTAATLAQPYLYDADGRAEASGSTPITWSVVGAPSGFTISAQTGQVSWTPSVTGSFSVTIRASNALGAESQSFVVTVGSEAPLPASVFPVNAPALVYCPPERLALGPAKSEQRLNVFLPRGAPPAGGWPVVVNTRVGGGFATLPLARIDSTGGTAPLHAFIASGIAVVDYGVPAIGGGNGLFYPPGHASGRYESFRPADDNPEKAAEWAVQWAKSQTLYPLDPNRVCLRGSSQGAMIALWAAMGPERARASGSPQVQTSTRVRGVLALQPPASMWAFDQDATLSSKMIAHFEQASLPGVPCTALRQALRSLQEAASVMRFGFESSAALAHNQTQPLCLVFNEPVKRIGGVVADMGLDATGFPRLTDAIEQPLVHDSWSGYVLWRRLLDLAPASAAFHAANSVFAIRDTSALAAPLNWHTRTYSGTITGSAANSIAHEWVLRTLLP